MNYCEDCQYYQPEIAGIHDANKPQTGKAGKCNRFPPSPFPAQTRDGLSTIAVWPMVNAHDRCGEFRCALEGVTGN